MLDRSIPTIVVLNQISVPTARQLMTALPGSQLYGLAGRTTDVDVSFANFGDTVRQLYSDGVPIIGLCAAGILIRTLAPILTDSKTEPPIVAVAADGSAVVPLLGGMTGVNDLAEKIAVVLNVRPAIAAPAGVLGIAIQATAARARLAVASRSRITSIHLASVNCAGSQIDKTKLVG